jgi:hypothetical protein
VTDTTIVAEDWHNEVANDIAFPMVDIKKIGGRRVFALTKRTTHSWKS